MIEKCLNQKIIRDFLKNYSQDRWPFIISSLIEIAILNLNSSFNSFFFTEKDFNDILSNLKEKYNSQKQMNQYFYSREKIKNKPSTTWRNGKQKFYEDYEIICRENDNKIQSYNKTLEPNSNNNYYEKPDNNFDKIDFNYNYKISGHNLGDFILNKRNEEKIYNETIKRKNKENKKNIIKTQSRIKSLIDIDKENYSKSKRGNKEKKNFNEQDINKKIPRENYVISYDKDLKPQIIETNIKKNKNEKKNQKGTRIFNKKNNGEENNNFSYKNNENQDENYSLNNMQNNYNMEKNFQKNEAKNKNIYHSQVNKNEEKNDSQNENEEKYYKKNESKTISNKNSYQNEKYYENDFNEKKEKFKNDYNENEANYDDFYENDGNNGKEEYQENKYSKKKEYDKEKENYNNFEKKTNNFNNYYENPQKNIQSNHITNEVEYKIQNYNHHETQLTKTKRLNTNNMEEYSFKNVYTNNTNSINNTFGNNNSNYKNFGHIDNSNNDNYNTANFEGTNNNELQLSLMTNMSERTENLFQKEMNNFTTANSINI